MPVAICTDQHSTAPVRFKNSMRRGSVTFGHGLVCVSCPSSLMTDTVGKESKREWWTGTSAFEQDTNPYRRVFSVWCWRGERPARHGGRGTEIAP